MISFPRRAHARRYLAVGIAAGLSLSALAVVRTISADAATVPYNMTCTVLGSPSTVTTNVTTSVTPDPVVAGGPVTLNVTTSPPTGVPLDVPVTAVKITIPIPAQVDLTAPSSVTLTGGNLTGSGSVQGSSLVVSLTGNVTAFNLQIPTMSITSRLKPDVAGQTINFQGPSNLDITATVIGPLQVPCVSAAGNPPVATVTVAAAPTTTTTTTTTTAPTTTTTTTRPTTTTTAAPTTTTTRATTSTTRATTSTTRATTSTTRATTSTTRATTSTTRATTSTTRATTSTTRATTTTRPTTSTTQDPGHGGFIDLIRRILCLLFRIGC